MTKPIIYDRSPEIQDRIGEPDVYLFNGSSSSTRISLSSTSSASANWTTINNAINQIKSLGGGRLFITSLNPGQPILINQPIVSAGVPLTLDLDPGVYLKLDTNSNCNLFQTACYASTGVNASSVTSAGRTVSVTTSAAHGLAVGDYVSIYYALNPGINGCHRVDTVADTTHFTFLARNPIKAVYTVSSGTQSSVTAGAVVAYTYSVTGLAVGDGIEVRKPNWQPQLLIMHSTCLASNVLTVTWKNMGTSSLAPTASETLTVLVSPASTNVTCSADTAINANIVIKKADTNLKIIGGIWDQNYLNQNGFSTTSFIRHGMVLSGVHNLDFRPDKIINVRKFCAYLSNVDLFSVGTIDIVSASDGIHCGGGVSNGEIGIIRGDNGDDTVALIGHDVNIYATEVPFNGDVSNVLVKGCEALNTAATSSIALYNMQSSTYTMTDINIYAANSISTEVKMTGNGATDTAYFDRVTFSGISGNGDTSPSIFGLYGVVRNLQVRDGTYKPAKSQNFGYLDISALFIDSLTIRNIQIPESNVANSSPAIYMFILGGFRNASISNIVHDSLHSATNDSALFNMTSAFGCLRVSSVGFEKDYNNSYNGGFLTVQSGAKYDQILLEGVRLGGYVMMSCLESGGDIILNGVNSPRISQFLISLANNKSCRILGDALNCTTGHVLTLGTGATVDIQSWAIPFDVSTTGVNKTRGNFALHTGSTAPGLAYADGTNWKNVNGTTIV